MHIPRRYWWWALAVGGGAALVALLGRTRPEPVETAVAGIGAVVTTVDEEGRTRIRDRYLVTAPVVGVVARIGLLEGTPVRAGDVVARLTPSILDPRARREAEARRDAAADAARSAAASARSARSAWEQAHRERVRAERLAAPGVIPPQERERAEVAESTATRALEAAEYRARAAQHDVELARAALAGDGALLLGAPVSGKVLRVPERSERPVLAGTVLAELGDPRSLEVVLDLLSADAAQVRPSDPVVVTGWGGLRPLPATIRTIEPSAFTKLSALGVEEQRVHVIADLAEVPPELGDGFRVDASVVIWRADSVLRIPANALVRRASGWSVYVVEAGRARERAVTVGHQGGGFAEIAGGLKPGEAVIRQPGDRIGDGTRVAAR
ncbi:MAG TPA: efflux RND transporter periplasmic adaptor subunit [Gemmatimonadales bacterium]|nr:efflux RND transporter periplasmic adaptor subunit [Gemmatimonadales bacterium]